MAVKNRFNNITSKEWLPFQKSWFVSGDDEALYKSNIRFFTQINEENPKPKIYYTGCNEPRFKNTAKEEGRQYCGEIQENLMFAVLDLRQEFSDLATYTNKKAEVISKCQSIFNNLQHRKFLAIFIKNIEGEQFAPIAWDLAQNLKSIFSLKDEKVAGIKPGEALEGDECFYALYLRKDEKSNNAFLSVESAFLSSGLSTSDFRKSMGAWRVVRPPRRKKNEILHPAKFPETLISQFIGHFTKEGDNVFDPMSGTGSTQVAALLNGRNGYGTELSPFFHEIAVERCNEFAFGTNNNFEIKLENAKKVNKLDFPEMDYLITSPPYWDMLNMKGAEYQARRKEKGLQLNYSDDKNDLGNLDDYEKFIKELVKVYKACDAILKSGAHITIILKNIKKKGSNYPFAWDLSNALCAFGWEILPEFFWCQDDINLAPYGYGNTWVSNTFHQYCLNFRKP